MHSTGFRAGFRGKVERLDALRRADADRPQIRGQEQVRDGDRLLVEHEEQARRAVPFLQFIEEELGKTLYFAGAEFTAADIMMMYCFGIVRSPIMKTEMAQYPNIAAYIARIEARPAYQKAMAIANPKKG